MKNRILIPVILLFFILVLFTIKLPILTLSSENNLTYKMFFISSGVIFNLSYIHSVEKTEVIEKYRIGNGYVLILDSIIFESQGAGLPFDYPGINFRASEGKFIFENINHPLKEIPIMPHEVSRNSFEIYGKVINLWILNNNISPCIIKVEHINITGIILRIINKLLDNLL